MSGRFRNLSQSGFTVIEILIVLTIVLIIALLVVNNLQDSVAKGRDIERRTDINATQEALEGYWHSYEHYPADLTTLGIDGEILIDPSANAILISPATRSQNKPVSGYAEAQPEQEYTYAPYQCGNPTESQAAEKVDATGEAVTDEEAVNEAEQAAAAAPSTCQKYVLYSWLEKAEIIPYEKSNFHNVN